MLRNELLRYMLHTCPNCDATCAQSATQWTASVHTLHVPQPGVGWGGVGCNDMHCTCAHVGCYAIALAHMFHARIEQLYNMKRKPRGLSKKKGTQTIDRAWLSLKRFVPKEPTKRKAKECLQMSANFSKRGSSNGQHVLNSCV